MNHRFVRFRTALNDLVGRKKIEINMPFGILSIADKHAVPRIPLGNKPEIAHNKSCVQ